MDLRKIKKLIELVEESGIAELEVRDGDEAIRIARPGGMATPVALQPAAPALQPAPPSRGSAAAVVAAPMAGTFYAASAPAAERFVRVGDRVEVGQVVCIIESMKMMNEITAEHAGVCSEILVDNGQAVESGQALIALG